MLVLDGQVFRVAAVLSSRRDNSPKLHPCTTFSHKRSTAEQNYDVGNQECHGPLHLQCRQS